jgi:hypothetical protein
MGVAHLKLEAELPHLRCSFEAGEELAFHCETIPPVVVSLKQAIPKDEAGSAGTANTICTAICTIDVTPEIEANLSSSLDHNGVKISTLQRATLKTIDDIFHHIRAVSQSTIIMLNWTHGLDGPPDPYGLPRAWYSNDGNKWFRYSQVRKIEILLGEATHSLYAKNVKIDEIVRKVEAGAEEPLARQLFREAWGQIGINPRSALVIGVSAAEIGLKELIAALIPGTDWLMQEIPTPPVGKVLRKFLPTLQVRAKRIDGGPITPPRQLILQIEKAVEYRNDVVHAGRPPPARQELAVMLRAISDFLWMCDIYLGEHWAIKHISPNTLKHWQSKSS